MFSLFLLSSKHAKSFSDSSGKRAMFTEAALLHMSRLLFAAKRNAHEQTIIFRQLFAVPSANQNDGKNNMNDNVNLMYSLNNNKIFRTFK
jgi:hypothetical protein